MNTNPSFLSNINDPESVITAINSNPTFPEFLRRRVDKYSYFIDLFIVLVLESSSSAELLYKIRDSETHNAEQRMSLLKIFRRAVSTVIDTEKSKKLKIPTAVFVDNYGHTFKDIVLLQKQCRDLNSAERYALAALLGEYDDRGKQGYILTDIFFSWFENKFSGVFTIEGPRGAGRDIQLSDVYDTYQGNFPCDFVIKDAINQEVLVIGFARYDSTRGGSQSDDRTGGNNDKVLKTSEHRLISQDRFKILFLSDGPGLTHKDTWEESCILDGKLEDHVRVSTLKLADTRITEEWIRS